MVQIEKSPVHNLTFDSRSERGHRAKDVHGVIVCTVIFRSTVILKIAPGGRYDRLMSTVSFSCGSGGATNGTAPGYGRREDYGNSLCADVDGASVRVGVACLKIP